MAAFLYLIAFALFGLALALTLLRAQAGCKLSPPTSVLTKMYRIYRAKQLLSSKAGMGTVCIKVKNKNLGRCWE